MVIAKERLDKAVKAGIISSQQADKLWSFWTQEQEDVPGFRFAHVMYYFGGLLAISAVTLFVTQAWDTLRGLPLFILSSLLIYLGFVLTHYFLQKKLSIPAGILATFTLCVVPLAVYNIQLWLGLLPQETSIHYNDYNTWISWYWVPMELATLFVGVIMLYCYRFPFLLFPIGVTLLYLSMDFCQLLFNIDSYTWRPIFSMYFGLIVLALAIYMDFKDNDDQRDYAFWLYIFGAMIFWGGLSLQQSDSEISKFIYCLINIFMIMVSVFLDRRVFAIFGALGVLGYLSYLSFNIFANSLGFPIVLIFLGLLIIFAATRWSKMEKKLVMVFYPYIPEKVKKRMINHY